MALTGNEKNYIKTYCPGNRSYGIVVTEKVNGTEQITNFYGIDRETAESIKTSYEGRLPEVSGSLKPCTQCGERRPMCCDKHRKCPVKKGEMWYQCLYCSSMEIVNDKPDTGSDIYFLMDNSASMSAADREEASDAVKNMIQSLEGMNNRYSFVAWASKAGYIFRNESNLLKIEHALADYRNGNCEYTGSTAAEKALRCIKNDVLRSERPAKIILVTDGQFDSTEAAVKARDALLNNQRSVEIMAVGVTGADEDTLKMIGTVRAFSRVVGSTKALLSTFEQIAEELKKNRNNY